jgi:hypothetical protein
MDMDTYFSVCVNYETEKDVHANFLPCAWRLCAVFIAPPSTNHLVSPPVNQCNSNHNIDLKLEEIVLKILIQSKPDSI